MHKSKFDEFRLALRTAQILHLAISYPQVERAPEWVTSDAHVEADVDRWCRKKKTPDFYTEGMQQFVPHWPTCVDGDLNM